jgi:aromatic-amino-acid transaminase
MRTRIKEMRQALVSTLAMSGAKQDFSFVAQQRGMFSYSGLTSEQVDRLREEHGIYAIASGRICVAALNQGNVQRVAEAVAKVIG